MISLLRNSIGIALSVASTFMLAHAANAQATDSFGPGKVWCASQVTCHLRTSSDEDYGFNGSTLPPPVQQVLLGPCQMHKECIAEMTGVQLPHIALIGNPQIVRWVSIPAELKPMLQPVRVSAAAASAGMKSDRRR